MRRVSTITAIAGAAVALTAPAAGAAGKGGWQPFRTQPFTTPGVCSFTVQGDIVRDEEETRIDATFPDGSPRVQEFRGPLVIRFTNTSNGKSAVRDVSGYGRFTYKPDGGFIGFFNGGASVRIFSGNPTTPAGWYIVHGIFRLTIAADGTRDLDAPNATIEDLCHTLA